MIIYKESTFSKNQLTMKQRVRRTRIGMLLALLVILIGAAIALWQGDREQREAKSANGLLAHDLQTLWDWSNGQLQNGSKGADWTVRWDAQANVGAMNELAEKLFYDEKNGTVAKVVKNNGKTITGVVAALGGRVSISLIETDSDNEHLMLLLETNAKMLHDKNMLLNAAEQISKELGLLTTTITSSMKVQGFTDNKHAAEGLKKGANAKEIDRYDDKGIISETLYSGMLRSSIKAGGGKSANLQIAVHKESNSGKTALTIGIPLITGDYSVTPQNELQ